MFTQGITQAGRDLEPDSRFLAGLNSHPRRAGVRYTIIAGDQPIAFRVAAQTMALGDRLLDDVVPDSGAWRHIDSAIDGQIQRLGEQTGQSDGPVSLDSARLAGVDDFVIVPADHIALYQRVQGHAPASWPIIQERLDEHRHGG
jgi:hypothetical protein